MTAPPTPVCPVSLVAVGRHRNQDSSATPIKTLLYFVRNPDNIHRFAECLDKEVRIRIKSVLVVPSSNFAFISLDPTGDSYSNR